MNLETAVKNFLESGAESLDVSDLGRACPDSLQKAFEKAGGKLDDGSFESNGWEWDWWSYGSYKGTKILMTGSGYYGSASISRQTED